MLETVRADAYDAGGAGDGAPVPVRLSADTWAQVADAIAAALGVQP